MSNNLVDYSVQEEINNVVAPSNEYVKELEAERDVLHQKVDELTVKLNEQKEQDEEPKTNYLTSIISLFWTLVSFFAIYLSFKCNKGFNLVGFLGALLLGPFYIAYKLGTHWDVCMGTITPAPASN
tara:strand:- start:51 stop:428 length:378 start_codon:yes stop_codon:yes gene_type:complete